eukprot:1939918-Prymnesium_polylepis.2
MAAAQQGLPIKFQEVRAACRERVQACRAEHGCTGRGTSPCPRAVLRRWRAAFAAGPAHECGDQPPVHQLCD